MVLADAPQYTPNARPYRYVSRVAPSSAELYSHEDITADAVRPVPTLRLATIKLEKEKVSQSQDSCKEPVPVVAGETYVSVVLLSSLNAFFITRVTHTMPTSLRSVSGSKSTRVWTQLTQRESHTQADYDTISGALR